MFGHRKQSPNQQNVYGASNVSIAENDHRKFYEYLSTVFMKTQFLSTLERISRFINHINVFGHHKTFPRH